MTTAKPSYASVNTMTITLASLAASATAGQQSTAADNTADLAIDAEVQLKVTTGTTPVGGLIEFWAYSSADGLIYSGNATGTNGALTPINKVNMQLLELIAVTSTSNQTYITRAWSIANAFGGSMPHHWGVWVLNNTSAALNSTAGNQSVKYGVLQYTNA